MYACLGVTCHLHLWQNDRGRLLATSATRSWNGQPNKSQPTKLTLEKKIRPPLLPEYELATFRSRRVRRSSQPAVPYKFFRRNNTSRLRFRIPFFLTTTVHTKHWCVVSNSKRIQCSKRCTPRLSDGCFPYLRLSGFRSRCTWLIFKQQTFTSRAPGDQPSVSKEPSVAPATVSQPTITSGESGFGR